MAIAVPKNSNSFTMEGQIAKALNELYFGLAPDAPNKFAFRSGFTPRNLTGNYILVNNLSTQNFGYVRSYAAQTGSIVAGKIPVRKIYTKKDTYSFNFYGFYAGEVDPIIEWLYDPDTIALTELSFRSPLTGLTNLHEYQAEGAVPQLATRHYNINFDCYYEMYYTGSEADEPVMQQVSTNIIFEN